MWLPVANTLFETYQMLWSQATLIYGVLWPQNNPFYNSHLDFCHLAFSNDTGTVLWESVMQPCMTQNSPRLTQTCHCLISVQSGTIFDWYKATLMGTKRALAYLKPLIDSYGSRTHPVQPRIPYTDPGASVTVPDTPGPYADWNLINWSSGERKLFGVLHVTHISDLGPVGDSKIKSISPRG